MTNWVCNQCGSKIRFWISLCKICLNRRRHSTAIISQNKKKLKKLLEESDITAEWIDKFVLYANNIIENWKVIMEFLEKDNRRRYNRVMKHKVSR